MSEFNYTSDQEAWLQDLETTDAKQGSQRLHSHSDNFCCLGRACVTLGVPKVINSTGDYYTYMLDEGMLRRVLFKQLGLRDGVGSFSSSPISERPIDEDGLRANGLAGLNDVFGWSFKQIAAFIRENPEMVFTNNDKEKGFE